MMVRLKCRACGKRLKLPEQVQPRQSARCPKCLAHVDLTAALEASAYQPAPASSQSPFIREEDPLPYPIERNSPPLAGSSAAAMATAPAQVEPLSLDDDPEPDEPPPPAVTPFRVPAEILAPDANKPARACFAVLVPHGLFLESQPMRPFLYFPIGSGVVATASRELTITQPDGAAATLRFTGRAARALARDTRAFLSGERTVPVAAEYRRNLRLVFAAVLLALGLFAAVLAAIHNAGLGRTLALQIAAGFGFAVLTANLAVVNLRRWSPSSRMQAMVGIGLLSGWIVVVGIAAYSAGWNRALVELRNEEPRPPLTPAPVEHPPPASPEPPPDRPPTHLDRAKKLGASALEDAASEVTAMALAPDGNTLGIGHADGTTRLWPLDQPTFEAIHVGPHADGPVTRIEFERKSRFVFAHTVSGVFVAPGNGAPAAAVKIPGTHVAIAPDLESNHIRFAAVRGNAMYHRMISTAFVQMPPLPQDKSRFVIPGRTDEIAPPNHAGDVQRFPARLTFLAWTPSRRLFAGNISGAIAVWDANLKPEVTLTEHRAFVRAWAECLSGDFATGDDKGNVALWQAKGGKPALWTIFNGSPIIGLCFNKSGTLLAATDNTGWIAIWDTVEGKALHRIKRPAAVKAMAFGPTDDFFILASGRTVEIWWLPELVK